MFALDRVIDKRRKAVASAHVLFRGGGIGRRAFGKLHFLVGTQFQAESFDDTLHDRVLHTDDVAGVRIDSFTPENLAGAYVEQLGADAQTIARAQKSRGENRVHTQFTTSVSRID